MSTTEGREVHVRVDIQGQIESLLGARASPKTEYSYDRITWVASDSPEGRAMWAQLPHDEESAIAGSGAIDPWRPK